MQMLIRANGFLLNSSVKRYVNDRVSSIFSRFSGVIRKIEVYIADENGPKGGVDKTCVVKIKLDQVSEIVVKDVEADVYTVIQRALIRAKQSLAKHLQKSRVFMRKRISYVNDSPEALGIGSSGQDLNSSSTHLKLT